MFLMKMIGFLAQPRQGEEKDDVSGVYLGQEYTETKPREKAERIWNTARRSGDLANVN